MQIKVETSADFKCAKITFLTETATYSITIPESKAIKLADDLISSAREREEKRYRA